MKGNSIDSRTRSSGIGIVGDVKWGTHFCQFYQTKEDLLDVLVPYFRAGLKSNEFCMWITSGPLGVEDAKAALKRSVRNLGDRLEQGQIEILDYTQWYTKSGKFDSDRVLKGWVEKEEKALKKGYQGLRLTGNTFWLERNGWKAFTQYEKEVNEVIGEHRMIALCTYSLEKCDLSDIIDVIDNHQFALVRRQGKWDLIESVKQVEKRLRRLNAYNRGLIEASLDPLVTIDRDGKITDVNAATEAVTGYQRERLVGTDFSDYFKEPEKARAGYQRVWSEGSVRDYPLTILHRNGQETPVLYNATLYRDEAGELVGIFAAARDITERRQMENQLRQYSEHLEELVKDKTRELSESEKRYREVLESVPDIIFVHQEGRLLYMNPAGLRLLGATNPDEIIGKHILNIVHPDFREIVRKRIEGATEGRRAPPQEMKYKRVDGSYVDVETEAIPFIYENKSTVLGTARDITERKKLEAIRDQFISAVTHELRTPLVSIKGYIDYILSGNLGTIPEKVENGMKVVKGQSDRLLDLTDELLDYRRLISGKFQLTLNPVDLKEIIDISVKEIQPFIESKKQTVRIEIPKERLIVRADKARLIQVLTNILNNATKYTPENGQLSLGVERGKGQIRVSVSDTGLGIKREDLIRVFEPFAAIEKPAYIKGTGLGLSVSRALVEAHGGLMWAESDGIGKGATFTFSIPAST